MSYNDLKCFERGLQETYTCEVSFTHSKELQKIVDYYRFNQSELWNLLKGYKYSGVAMYHFDDHQNDLFFHNNIKTISYLIEVSNKIKFIYCNNDKHSVLMLLAFLAKDEASNCKLLARIGELKAFL